MEVALTPPYLDGTVMIRTSHLKEGRTAYMPRAEVLYKFGVSSRRVSRTSSSPPDEIEDAVSNLLPSGSFTLLEARLILIATLDLPKS
jgi:hypothetical protein